MQKKIQRYGIGEHCGEIFRRLISEIRSRPDQPEFPMPIPSLSKISWGWPKGKVSVVSARPSHGKCHRRGDKILMYDGSIRNVEDVKIGDKLMGPDSKPRNVLSLGNGFDLIYRVIPNRGKSFFVNGDHILSLKKTGSYNSSPVNISIDEYFRKSKKFKHQFKLWKTGVKFSKKKIPFDPYVFGLWLGDGTRKKPEITNPDDEIIPDLKRFCIENNFKLVRHDNKNRCRSFSFKKTSGKKNKFLNWLKSKKLHESKYIPSEYLVNSLNNRLELLAGLIDTDGYRNSNSGLEITLCNDVLAQDIVFLANSCGFNATIKKRIARIKKINYSTLAYRVSICGDLKKIPLRIKRKIPEKNSRESRMTCFSIIPVGSGEFFGFTLDQDGLYLTEDFFVTHNTAFIMQSGLTLAKENKNVLFLSLEDSKEGLVEKLFCQNFKIFNQQLKRNQAVFNEELSTKIFDTLPIYLIDGYGFNESEIEDIYNTVHFEDGRKADIIFWDYVQCLDNASFERYTELMHWLRDFAKRIKIPVVIGSQQSRIVTMQNSGGVSNSGMKGSGAIEETAELIVLLWYPYNMGLDKPEYVYNSSSEFEYLSEDEKDIVRQTYFEISISKNKTGGVYHNFKAAYYARNYWFQEWTGVMDILKNYRNSFAEPVKTKTMEDFV